MLRLLARSFCLLIVVALLGSCSRNPGQASSSGAFSIYPDKFTYNTTDSTATFTVESLSRSVDWDSFHPQVSYTHNENTATNLDVDEGDLADGKFDVGFNFETPGTYTVTIVLYEGVPKDLFTLTFTVT